MIKDGSMTPRHYPPYFRSARYCAEVTVFFTPLKGEAKVAEGTEEAPPPSANHIDRFTKTALT